MIGPRNQKISRKKDEKKKKFVVLYYISFGFFVSLLLDSCVCSMISRAGMHPSRYCSELLLYDSLPLQCPLTNISIQLPPFSFSPPPLRWTEPKSKWSFYFVLHPATDLSAPLEQSKTQQIASSLNGSPERKKEKEKKKYSNNRKWWNNPHDFI